MFFVLEMPEEKERVKAIGIPVQSVQASRKNSSDACAADRQKRRKFRLRHGQQQDDGKAECGDGQGEIGGSADAFKALYARKKADRKKGRK